MRSARKAVTARYGRRDTWLWTSLRARGGRRRYGESGPSRVRPQRGDQSFLIDRVATTRRLLQTQYMAVAAASDAMQNAQQFRLRLHAVLRENGRLDIQAGRFTLAAEQLAQYIARELGEFRLHSGSQPE